MRAISYGGGVQSTALLVLAARWEIDYPLVIMADVGADSENPETVAFVERHAKPYAAAHGIELLIVHRTRRTGEVRTLLQTLHMAERSIDIPMRMANGAPGNRNCTVEFKIKPIANELKRRGATKTAPAHLALGISVDEFQRMNTSRIPHVQNEYPLIDRRMDRSACLELVKREMGVEPPRSACWFCPYFSLSERKRQLREYPELFEASANLEDLLNARRATLGKDQVFLTSRLKPLREAIQDDGQTSMFDGGACDIGGYCYA